MSNLDSAVDDLLPLVGDRRRRGFCSLGRLVVVMLLLWALGALALYKRPSKPPRNPYHVVVTPGPAPPWETPSPTPAKVVKGAVRRHIGLLPKHPGLSKRGLWDQESKSYCMNSEPRFNANCEKKITWRQRKTSLMRCLAESSMWLEHFQIAYYVTFSTLFAIYNQDEEVAWTSPCELAVSRPTYEKLVAMITTGWRAGTSHEFRYSPNAVVEDNPWDTRSNTFPEFKGEWWVPFDKVLQHEHQGQKVNVTDVGLLYKPKEHCTPLRAVDKRTGFFCDLLVVDTEHEDGHWALQWPSGPRACPHAPEPSRQCDSKACYRLPGTSMYPARRCWLAHIPLMCPNDPETALNYFYVQLRMQHARARDKAKKKKKV
eukprot:g4773.t1